MLYQGTSLSRKARQGRRFKPAIVHQDIIAQWQSERLLTVRSEVRSLLMSPPIAQLAERRIVVVLDTKGGALIRRLQGLVPARISLGHPFESGWGEQSPYGPEKHVDTG